MRNATAPRLERQLTIYGTRPLMQATVAAANHRYLSVSAYARNALLEQLAALRSTKTRSVSSPDFGLRLATRKVGTRPLRAGLLPRVGRGRNGLLRTDRFDRGLMPVLFVIWVEEWTL